MGRTQLPNPGILNERERQNIEAPAGRIYNRAIYWSLAANGNPLSKLVGVIPKDCVIINPVSVVIQEAFNGDNIWIKIGTSENIQSVGKVLSHVAGVFEVKNSSFSVPGTDYGRIFKQSKQIIVSLIAEAPSALAIARQGVAFGIIPYVDLTQVEGY